MTLNLIHIFLSLFLIIAILLQRKSKSFDSKRGLERILFLLTIVVGILFLISSILIIIKD